MKEELREEFKQILKKDIESGKIHFKTKKNKNGTATHIRSYLLDGHRELPLNTIFNIVTGCRLLTNGDISIKGSGFNAVHHLLSLAWYNITGQEAYNFKYEKD